MRKISSVSSMTLAFILVEAKAMLRHAALTGRVNWVKMRFA
jgi:hypothetical protein